MKKLFQEINDLDLNSDTLVDDAKILYTNLVHALFEKYGSVDDDYDENPTQRGKEWLDIHHIDETILDDIARRTNQAKKEYDSTLLKKLKPLNKKERLVYANKIEHFLLHYLIDCMRGPDIFSGGPNFLWDSAIALKYFVLKAPHLVALQNREDFYNDISLIDLTKLYKKLIDWKQWSLPEIIPFWKTVMFNQAKDKTRFDKEILAILKK